MPSMDELSRTMEPIKDLYKEFLSLYEKCYGDIPEPHEVEELIDREEAMENESPTNTTEM